MPVTLILGIERVPDSSLHSPDPIPRIPAFNDELPAIRAPTSSGARLRPGGRLGNAGSR